MYLQSLLIACYPAGGVSGNPVITGLSGGTIQGFGIADLAKSAYILNPKP